MPMYAIYMEYLGHSALLRSTGVRCVWLRRHRWSLRFVARFANLVRVVIRPGYGEITVNATTLQCAFM